MLTSDLTLTSNADPAALPGDTGATVFAQITGPSGNTIKRQVAATAGTTPEVLTIAHTETGTGYKRRRRTLVKLDFTALNTDIADTGGVTPGFSTHWVLDRPIQSGGAVTDTIIKRQIGRLLHCLLTVGHLDKLLNSEA